VEEGKRKREEERNERKRKERRERKMERKEKRYMKRKESRGEEETRDNPNHISHLQNQISFCFKTII
jgi:hypothetical protein